MKEQKKSASSINKMLIFIFVSFFIIIIVARYATDEEYRKFINTDILKKEVYEENLKYIEINSDANPSIYAYDKYIAILSKNSLKQYDSSGKKIGELEVNISVPLVETNGKYLILAEKDGEKIYLISGSNILWSDTVDGNISRVNVNKNGYVSIVITNTIYKSVIVYYDPNGKEIFRTYLSDSYAVCTSISTNNKYLAIGEINYTSTIIKSCVKIISVDLAQDRNKAADSIIYTYESENGEIITNINYQDKENAICMFSNYIQKIGPDSNERVYDYSNNDLFVDINLKNGIALIKKQSSGLFTFEYDVTIKNLDSKIESLYILNSDLPRNVTAIGNNIALNLGNEVQIINSSGWLLKKYNSSRQIKSLVLGETIAGIVYKNKIEIVEL